MDGGFVPIHELRQYDRNENEVRVPVVLLGARAVDVCREVDGAPGTYKVLRLAKLRDTQPVVHLYALATDDPARAALVWQHLAHTAWLVIAARAPADDPSWKVFEELGRVLDAQRRDVVVTLLGDAHLADVWRAYGGPAPLAVTSKWTEALKPLVKDALSRRRDPLRWM